MTTTFMDSQSQDSTRLVAEADFNTFVFLLSFQGTHIVTLIFFGCIAIVWTVFVTHLFHKTTPYPKWLYSIVTSFRFLYRRTQFGKEEAKARKTLRESRDALDEDGTELDDIQADDGGTEQPSGHRWYHFKSASAKRKIQTFSCFKCGKDNPTIVEEQRRRKKPRINFDPQDVRLWQETANLLDRFMGYVMILVTIIIYIVLLWNFGSHDPHTYQLDKH